MAAGQGKKLQRLSHVWTVFKFDAICKGETWRRTTELLQKHQYVNGLSFRTRDVLSIFNGFGITENFFPNDTRAETKFWPKTVSPADFVGNIVCSFKFLLEVGVEESFVNAPWITDHGSALFNLTSLFALVVFLVSGAFTIDSSKPTLRINLNELPIEFVKLTVTSEASTVFCC
jgi:hypothetical protein